MGFYCWWDDDLVIFVWEKWEMRIKQQLEKHVVLFIHFIICAHLLFPCHFLVFSPFAFAFFSLFVIIVYSVVPGSKTFLVTNKRAKKA